MNISIFGMGYVGTTTAACLLGQRHDIVAVDVDVNKVKKLALGKSPMIHEEGIDELLEDGFEFGFLTAETNAAEALVDCDLVIICVGTPSKFDGSIDLSYVEIVIKEIGEILKDIPNRPTIVVRSTCLPGTMENVIRPLLEATSGLEVDKDIDLVFHPEFLREGTAVEDFKNPPKIVVGENREGASDTLLSLYEGYDAPVFRLNYGEAEMVKYCDNIFHALKITFANEVASISNFVGIDSRKVAEVYCADKKLNISPTYLSPGFAYGGSCLPKDLRAMLRFASLNYLHLPMMQGIVDSNAKQIENFLYRIMSFDPSTIGMVGIAFKEGTNDMRNSPHVEVAKTLIGEGFEPYIYDPALKQEPLVGSNKEQVYNNFRNLDELLVSSIEGLNSCDLIIVNHNIIDADRIWKWLEHGVIVLDTVGIKGVLRAWEGYHGIYW